MKAEHDALKSIDAQLADQKKRLTKTFELVEDGVYTRETFLQRQSEISGEMERLQKARLEIRQKIELGKAEIASREDAAPRIRHVLDVYDRKLSPAERNKLLKQVIERIDYHKTTKQRWSTENDLSIAIHPKILSHH